MKDERAGEREGCLSYDNGGQVKEREGMDEPLQIDRRERLAGTIRNDTFRIILSLVLALLRSILFFKKSA